MDQHPIAADSAERIPAERHFTSWDGTDLFYREWEPQSPSRQALVLLHRGHEHSGRFQDFVDRGELDEFWMFAWDARGHGHSPGERGYAPSFGSVVRDLGSFVEHISRSHDIPIGNIAIVANSIGAVVAATWVHDYAPPIRALVLATPAFRVKLYVPLALPGLRALQKIRKKSFVKSYVRPSMLTHDEEMIQQMAEDSLISDSIAVNILVEMHDTATRIMDDAGAIHVPTLVLSAGSDWVVHLSAQRRFFERLSSRTKEMVVYQAFSHAVLHEKERDRPIAKIREFITNAFRAPFEQESLLLAHQAGFTKQASDRLRKPLALVSPRGMYFGSTKLVLKTIGQLGHGIRIGWRAGFNSGESLDHVYRNRPRGTTPLGWLADRLYLNSPGWKGIRQRKLHVEQLLERAIREANQQAQPSRLLDIAAGPGRYVLDVVERLPECDISAVLRDQNPKALELGRELAAERNLAKVVFEVGDAFDEQALAMIQPRPTIAIVSGLYELFSDNTSVTASLKGLARAMEEDAYLIYTNQAWHPQLELIARTLVGMDGQPWIMRCRTQLEMDQLVAAAGFRKVDMLIDDQGIFTVSLARRISRS
ncbi:MAG TPA: bifunctional alpha/beta hydrolase/class I SAM-dependent methyltransferase [Pirellulaceae bacterium]|nr:bifunctional alpha/beta hydrolase/class I SAM-dependent methyltransferase [Pirellulaceae bacterium]